MGGFGGALKQLSIGCASSYGKAYIHGAGEPEKIWTGDHDSFLESMADAAEAVVRHFNGNMFFINVMKNMSVDCDCCSVAEDPLHGRYRNFLHHLTRSQSTAHVLTLFMPPTTRRGSFA